VSPDDQDRLDRAKAADGAGRTAEAYSLLLPLAEAGHAEAQGIVGSLMMAGLHRYETVGQTAAATTYDEQLLQGDRDQAARFLRAASDQGIGPASFNLASLLVTGHGAGTWEERKAEAAALYAKARAQGFTAFGWLMNGAGPGQPYLDLMERHAAGEDVPYPWSEPDDTRG
jgi:TPR repeat protein